MQVEAAQAVLANSNQDVSLVWDSNLNLWGLAIGFHMEYITPKDFDMMDEPDFMVIVHHRMMRYVASLKENPDFFYRN